MAKVYNTDYTYWKWEETGPSNFVCTGFNAAGNKCVSDTDTIKSFVEYNSLGDILGGVYCKPCANAKGIFEDSVEVEEKVKGIPKPKKCLGCGVEVCNVCAICHTEDCAYLNYKVTTPTMKAKYTHLNAKTQKARGYVVLAESTLKVPKPYRVIMDEIDIEAAVEGLSGKISFVRPCPMRPRHGFVDSRPMEINVEGTSRVELSTLLKQATAADEQGHAELLIVPYVKSIYNAIVTPTRVAVGPGNDGATGGHGSVSFPLAGVPFKEISTEMLTQARIGKDEDPYIEAVMSEGGEAFFTQIRAGVRIPPTVGADFVPFPVRVEEVIDASGDLLEWEAQTKLIKRGTVVCHLGGTLISHYGVHCMQNDIPVFTSRRPNIGEALEIVNKILKPNPQAVIRGLGAGVLLPLDVKGKKLADTELYIMKALVSMMTILHNSAAMSEDDGYWIGIAVAIMYRAGMAASHGEARHKLGMGMNRRKVYELALKDFFEARETLGAAQYRFLYNSWSSGYGGPAWAKCTNAILEMDNTIRELIKNPNQENVAALVGSLNNAVNQAHNGGWWLNKFIGQDWFTKASVQSIESVVVGMITMFRMTELIKPLEGDIDSVTQLWGEAPEITVKSGLMQIEKESGTTIPKPNVAPSGNGWSTPYAPNKMPEDVNYVGAYCEYCGHCFEYLGKSDIDVDQSCGFNGCAFLCGWYEDGKWSVPQQQYNHDDVGEIEEDEDFIPNSLTNMNGHVIPPGAKVQSAQAFISGQIPHNENKWSLHLQYKVDNSLGYWSTDTFVEDVDVALAKSHGGNASYSGSDNHKYFLFEVEESGLTWNLINKELKLKIMLNLKFQSCNQVKWKEVLSESKEETKEVEDLEIPF